MENKLTDNEIIKALECCEKPVGEGCKECPLYNTDCTAISLDAIALDLINRQKAEVEQWKEEANKYQNNWCESVKEIERLKAEIVIRDKIIDERGKEVIRHDNAIRSLHKQLDNLKSEAIKEFAEKFKKKAGSIVTRCRGYEIIYETKQYQISAINFDNLVKEMTE